MNADPTSDRIPRRRLRSALAVLSACGLLLTSCTVTHVRLSAAHIPAGTEATAATIPVPAGLLRYYQQQLDWKPCPDKPAFQCTTLKAPRDYAHPDAGDITLAATRKRATGTGAKRIGSLLYNPGGPGSPAITALWDVADAFSPSVRAAYDLVAVDPRGVGDSTPVDCDNNTAMTLLNAGVITTAGKPDFESVDALDEEIADACRLHAGRLLPYVGTLEAARDLDLMRALVGDDRLHFIGFSYGTYLGTTYAELFPSRVGRMVLDGAVDPSIDGYHRFLDVAHGYQVAWESFAADCATRTDCPVGHSVEEADRTLDALVAALDQNPLQPGKDVTITGQLLLAVVTEALRAPAWEELRALLSEVAYRVTTGVQKLSAADQEDSVVGDWGSMAVDCLSAPLGPRFTTAQAEAALPEFVRVSPQFGALYSTFLQGCTHWPVGPTQPSHRITAPGTPPILVAGTTRDPATPYAWSQALARQLSSGRLLTRNGDGHTAFFQGNTCVDTAIDRYLLSGQLPPVGTVCT
ncbi:proteinase [Streptomyces spiralis]|uniref:Proteinase n=1 Tax=Streptomyces spiralis TaxID=66376 RepID=A0A919E5P1_9ACTN|nr:alpha/beta hydrolase [Streptomyces spiralis]GHF15529.1 proteinase [Streptomyces spiralis]